MNAKIKAFFHPSDFHHRLKQKIKKKIFKNFYIDQDGSLQNSILLAGSMRSGTTWLAETLAEYYQYRIIREPLHSGLPHPTLRTRLYLPSEYESQTYFKIFHHILTGNLRTKGIDRINFIGRPKGRVIKGVHILLVLPWIQTHFDLPTVYILRHPCATAYSMAKIFRDRSNFGRLKRIFQQDAFYQHFLADKQITLDPEWSNLEIFALIWSIENAYALQHIDQEQSHIIFYEDLVSDYYREMQKMLNYLTPTRQLQLKRLRNHSSNSSSILISQMNAHQKITKWKKLLTEVQIKKVFKFVKRFGLDQLYTNQHHPNHDYIASL